MSSWTFTRTPAGPHLSSERISFRTAILPLSYPGRRRAVCRAVRPPTRKNLIFWKLGFRLEKIEMLVNKLNLSEVWLQTTTFTISCRRPKWSKKATWATTALLLPEAGLPDPMSHLHRLVWSQRSSAHLKELSGHQNRDRGWFCWRDVERMIHLQCLQNLRKI